MNRREAIFRVSALLGGTALVGGSGLLAACGRADTAARDTAAARGAGAFSPDDIAFLDEVSDTILPDTAKSPGAKAARTGAFMALMVTDTYAPDDQRVFRDGMKTLDDACQKAHGQGFVQSTPQQRLALLETLDREARTYLDAREAARRRRDAPRGSEPGAPQTTEQDTARPPGAAAGGTAVAADAPNHYFRMMKELAMLGYFTSEIGYTKAMRYIESPGRFDPCAPLAPGEPAWAPHA
jgi:hypothetical protein